MFTLTASLLIGLSNTLAFAPAKTQPARADAHPIVEERPAAESLTLPAQLTDAGWTVDDVLRLATFADIDTQAFDRFDPVVYPMTQPNPGWIGQGVRAERIPGQVVKPDDDRTRGFATLGLWPRGEILYAYSDEITDVWFNPPEDPSLDELNALSVIPNSSFVFLYINAILQDRVKFVGYDPAIHTGQGYLLLEVNGPESECFNVTIFGYQANPDGQLFNHCTWGDFGSIVAQFAGVMALEREHTRPDRDEYIVVNEQNIAPPPLSVGAGEWQINDFGYVVGDYDYGSITHFPELAGSILPPLLKTIEIIEGPAIEWLNRNQDVIDNLVAITPTLNFGDPDFEDELLDALRENIGTGAGFSTGDVNTLFELYGRPGDPTPWIFDPSVTCPADVNGDGKMTGIDLVAFLDLLNQQSIYADVNRDGEFNFLDFQLFYSFWRPGFCSVPGQPQPPDGRPVVGSAPG